MVARHVLAAVVVVVGWLAPVAAGAAAPCLPVARVDGEPALTGPVVLLLGERGVHASGVSRCGVVAVRLESDGARLRLALTDADGRRVVRLADDAEGAATIIESWVRSDVSAPLLATRAPTRPPVIHGASASAEPVPRYELALGPEVGAGSDGSLWAGGRLRACVYLGAWCAGAIVHYAIDGERGGDSDVLGSERQQHGILLVVSRPFAAGGLELTPGLAVGQATLIAHRDARDGHEDDDENPSSLALEAQLGLGWGFAGAWSLRADAVLAAMPLVEARFQDDEGVAEGAPALAGAPRVSAWLVLGLVYGGGR